MAEKSGKDGIDAVLDATGACMKDFVKTYAEDAKEILTNKSSLQDTGKQAARIARNFNLDRLELIKLEKEYSGFELIARMIELGYKQDRTIQYGVKQLLRIGCDIYGDSTHEHILGQGSYGVVYLRQNKTTGHTYAVKEFTCLPGDTEIRRAFETEIQILQRANHERIVPYHGFDEENHKLLIFMAYMSGGSLDVHLKKNDFRLRGYKIRLYTRQILEGLNYLHSIDPRILHRDIKSANILLDEDGNVKLADFGISRELKEKTSTMQSITKGCGTWHYMAPEISKGERYGRSCDIWSFGCVVVEMSTGHPPYHWLEGPQATFKVAEQEAIHEGYRLSDRVPEQLQVMLLKIFQYNRRDRPTARQLLEEDPYVNDLAAWSTGRRPNEKRH